MLRQIDRRKVYPPAARQAGQEGVVGIALSVDSSGTVLSVSVSRSSGIPALDQAALETARRASPLPRPPQSLGQVISLTASIRFTIR
ncbi:TonB family protein [Devosia chinhatensis]|uniref:TonB family protein n=1 Tax=Devosia aurantiaca TaxID=2714858 RepID=A0A6M1T0X5_9HYPH|nr:TonB family protein [Devosia aurantiaca]